MTDAERISGLATVATTALKMAEDKVLRVFALEALLIERGMTDIDVAIAEVLRRPDLAHVVQPILQEQEALRFRLGQLSPELPPLRGVSKTPVVN